MAKRFASDSGIAISILCVTRDCDSYLDLWLASLEDQLFPSHQFEVLVMDNASLDDTRGVLEKFAARKNLNLKFEANPEAKYPAACWNKLGEAAQGGILLFLQDNILAQPDLLVQHLMGHLEGEALLSGGESPIVHSHMFPLQRAPVPESRPAPVTTSDESNWREILMPFIGQVPQGEDTTSWLEFDASHSSVPRKVWKQLGGFRGESALEDFGEWGLSSRDFAFRAHQLGWETRSLKAPCAWRGLKPNLLIADQIAEQQMQRFLSYHSDLDKSALETRLREKLLQTVKPAWKT